MQVGPESAGADPGPACYGRGGTRFTVTDANVVLGFIRPHTFFGGRLRLDLDAAHAALQRLAASLSMEPMEAAAGVRRLVNFTMAQAMRLVSVERGHDPRDYTNVAYGGGGPLHAAQLADELGCSRVLLPRNPGIISALGLLIANTQQDFLVTRITPAGDATRDLLLESFRELEGRARGEFDSYGIGWDSVERAYALDMRYVGQAYELTMPVDEFVAGARPVEQLTQRFHEFHRARYGHASSREGVEIANFRLTALHRSRVQRVTGAEAVRSGPVVAEQAPVHLNGRLETCTFYRRESLPPGHAVRGPAVIEEATATAFIPEGWTGTVADAGNLILRRA
jgi:N-methylhydantoinase A